jgi:hypothetical protein
LHGDEFDVGYRHGYWNEYSMSGVWWGFGAGGIEV